MLWSVPVAVIFAREFLEALVIIVNYRSLVTRCECYSAEEKTRALRSIWIFAALGFLIAVLVILAVGIPLGILALAVEDKPAQIIEGVSKLVASVCILALSLKVPKWLEVGPYAVLAAKKKLTVSISELRFNVGWNIWREMAEIGIFLVPFFLSKSELEAIPLSALAGIAIATGVGGSLYVASRLMSRRIYLVLLMAGVTQCLAAGLFIGGLAEFEEISAKTAVGETKKVFYMPGCEPKVLTAEEIDAAELKGAEEMESGGEAEEEEGEVPDDCNFWNEKKLPLTLIRPFGYQQAPSVLTFTGFWVFSVVAFLLHALKHRIAEYKVSKLASDASDGGRKQRCGFVLRLLKRNGASNMVSSPAEAPCEINGTSAERNAQHPEAESVDWSL